MAWPEPVGVVTWMGWDILESRSTLCWSRHHPPICSRMEVTQGEVVLRRLGVRGTVRPDRRNLDCPASERSPLAELYDLNAKVLLLGVGPRKMTALHLAEYRGDVPRQAGCA